MAHGIGTLTELRLEPDGLSGRITCPPGLLPGPGQYLAASGPDPCEPLPIILYPTGYENGTLRVSAPLPQTWSAGMQIRLRGPLGNGFRLPPTTRRLALASLDATPARLLPLAVMALEQRAAVAVFARVIPPGLPEEVEVLPLDMLPEALTWADFLALESAQNNLPALRDRLGLQPFQRPACFVQVLVIAPMPCCGLAECGVCAVSTGRDWSLACSDGPVFDFQQLEGA